MENKTFFNFVRIGIYRKAPTIEEEIRTNLIPLYMLEEIAYCRRHNPLTSVSLALRESSNEATYVGMTQTRTMVPIIKE